MVACQFWSRLASLSVSALLVSASLRDGRPHANMIHTPAIPRVEPPSAGPVVSRNGTQLPPYNTTYYFDQLIDHNDPSRGTFKQRFWHTYEFYEEGGPIIIMTPGEGNADGYSGYLTNRTINGQIAQQQNGSTIVIEHRFYGLSNPLPDLTDESLKLLNIQQAIDDFEYFAQNVELPMPDGANLGPTQAPWVFVGGSYSGALTSWVMVNKPDFIWAGYSSSGVVEAILDYWGYFEPIRQNMPKNCSADVEAVIAHVDKVFTGDNQTAIDEIKALFGLSDLSHLDDVAGSLRNNLWDWQSLSPSSGPGAQFFQFCDALEVKSGVSAPAEGWGLDHALTAWGNYWTRTYYARICGTADAETCLGSYDPTQDYWTDTSVDNSGRSWFWQVCNEVGFLQDGPPENVPALVTRLVQPAYDLRQCTYMFPQAFSEPPVPAVNATNEKYKGWDVKEQRLFFANGVRDPWREATVSADGVDIPSTQDQPIAVGDGFHCSDLSTANAAVDPTVLAVQQKALGFMKTWLAEWPGPSASGRRSASKNSEGGIEVSSREAQVTPKAINAWFRDPGSF